MIDRDFRLHLKNGTHLKHFALREFIKAMRTGRMVAFAGSMISRDMNQDSWSVFLSKALADAATPTGAPLDAAATAAALALNAADSRLSADDGTLYYDFVRSIRGASSETDASGAAAAKALAPIFDLRAVMPAADKAIPRLIRDLGIRRVITTNYDMEFEWHWLLDSREKATPDRQQAMDEVTRRHRPSPDYKRTLDYRIERMFPEGSYAASDCFHRARTDRLFEFAVGSPDYSAHVMHLHGRSSDPETMVVGYGDYERQYRQSPIAALPFQHALRTMFAGNPVLFVGLGLNERELTATLEQFVSDNKPGHVAPAFVIWSPGNSPASARPADVVEPADELRRLKFFRKFGVLTLYDVELKSYTAAGDLPAAGSASQHRLSRSLALLAEQTRLEIGGHAWRADDWRSMAAFLDPPERTEDGVRIWEVEDSQESFDPLFRLPDEPFSWPQDTPSAPAPRPAEMDDPQYLLHILERTPPIRAFLDPPGLGHGYLNRVIAGLITGPLRNRQRTRPGGGGDIIYCQLNAGFSWEIDSTLSLLTGLYDGKLAFDDEPPRSRQSAIAGFWQELEGAIKSGAAAQRSIFVAINGVDRFFDSTGYPLSHELDLLIRAIHLRYNPPGLWDGRGAVREAHDKFVNWREGVNGLHPFNLLLFGTPRVARYLRSLETTTIAGDVLHQTGMSRAEARDLPASPQYRRNQSYALFGSLPPPNATGEPKGREIVDRIWSARSERAASDPPVPGLALGKAGRPVQDGEDYASAYLTLAADSFKQAYAAAGETLSLPVAAEARLALARHRRVGEQRRAFFEVYLDPQVLAPAIEPIAALRPRRVELALTILRTMAFVGQPVEPATLARSRAVGDRCRRKSDEGKAREIALVLRRLAAVRLVFEMKPFPGVAATRFGLHRALLHELRDRHTVPISDARTYASFNLPLFAAQPVDDHEPEPETYDQLEQLIDDLIDVQSLDGATNDELAEESYGLALRAAEASIRSYYTTSALLMQDGEDHGVARPRLADHIERLSDLIRAAERTAAARSALIEAEPDKANANALRAELVRNFFPDDLVWLHDQRGVALLAQGNLYEARHALSQADGINTRFVEFRDHLQNWRRIQLNMVHLEIERGKISHALSTIRRIEQSIEAQAEGLRWREMQPGLDRVDLYPTAVDAILHRYGRESRPRVREVDPVFPADLVLCAGLAAGYRGWCENIMGRFRTAELYFRQAIHLFRNLGEQRAYAMFTRFYGSLLVAMRQLDKAKATLELCAASAESSRQMDIAHLARIALTQLQVRTDPPTMSRADALRRLLRTLAYADRTQMYRVRIEARRALAELRLEQGDYDGALEQAADALAVATRFGFSLRKLSLRVLIGQVLIHRGDKVSGDALIDQALRMADRIGYQRVVETAQTVKLALA